MTTLTFMDKLQARWDEGYFVCVGLDSDIDKLPPRFTSGNMVDPQSAFNRQIIDATSDIVCAYKPNTAFYEALGSRGIDALEKTIDYITSTYPHIPVILDAKRADIGNTNAGYVRFAFDELGADAITVHPYLGREALSPFLERADKGIIVLCRTSNSGAGEFQDRLLAMDDDERNIPAMYHSGHKGMTLASLYKMVAYNVSQRWNDNGNCVVVVGATYPTELADVRKIIGNMPILIPGIGAQGGDLEATVRAGKDSKNQGIIINSSRGIIFASSGKDFAEAARAETLKLHDAITSCLTAA